MKYYRYHDFSQRGYYFDESGEICFPNSPPRVSVHLTEYEVIKETPKGKWICPIDWLDNLETFKKWISNRSKFAWDSKEKALESFIKRKQKQISILKDQLYVAERALEKGKSLTNQQK